MLGAILSEGKKVEDVEKSLIAEVKKLQDAPVSAAELEKAKNQLVTDQLRERETGNGKALALGEAAVLLGDPARVNTDLARLQAVTAADIQRVMKKFHRFESTGFVLPAASNEEGGPAIMIRKIFSPRPSPYSAALCVNAQTPQATPPPPAQPRSGKFPTPVDQTLPNGLRVIVIERTESPLISAQLLIKNGGEVDAPELAGLADMTANLLTKGTQTRDATKDRAGD